MGSGRSGSTVMNVIFDNHPQITGSGELQNTGRVWTDNEFCSCKENIHDCTFWSKVVKHWENQIGEIRMKKHFEEKHRLENFKSPVAWLKATWKALRSSDHLYGKELTELYRSIAKVSGKPYVADVSKNPLRALRILQNQNLDVRLIHFVRDGRAVAWSLKKAYKVDLEAGLQKELKPRKIGRTALFWVVVNIQSLFVKRFAKHYKMVRYEDLTQNPVQVLKEIGIFADVDFNPVLEKIEQDDPFNISHVLAGNKLRMSGKLKLVYKKDWSEKMTKEDIKSFNRFGGWMLKKFGYPLSTH